MYAVPSVSPSSASVPTRTPVRCRRDSPAARTPIEGSASTSSPSVPDSTRNRAGVPSSIAADHEELGVGSADDARLHAVEDEAVPVAQGGGGEVEGVEEHRRLGEGQRGGRDARSRAVAGERGQVGLLLGLGAPEPDGGGDGARGEGGDGEAHVAVRQGLGDEGAGGRRALLHDAAELLGHTEGGQADVLGGGQDLRRGRARLVGRGGGGPQHLGGQLADHVEEHRLVVGRREVEDAARRGVGGTCPGRAPSGAGEGPTGGGRHPEAVARGRVDRVLGLLAQAHPVDEVALRQPVDRGDRETDRVAGLAGGQPVATTRPEVADEGHGSQV